MKEPHAPALPQLTVQSTPAFVESFVTMAVSDAVALVCNVDGGGVWKETVITGGGTLVAPAPESATLSVGLEASLVIARVPLNDPVDCGANTMLKLGLLWSGPKVKGRLSPLMLNPAPVVVAPVTITLDPPELTSVSVSV